MIRFDNFKPQYRALQKDINLAVQRVLKSGFFILGNEVKSFEQEFAAYIGTRYAVGVASGTEAIALSLMALNITRGFEVITTNMTAYPTIAAIIQAGAKPVVVDICEETGLIDCHKITSKINKKTRAIIPVHLYGQSCDMKAIGDIARKYDLKIIEDCAQSAGATFGKKKTGNIGHCGAFSFYPTKNLGAYGDGGAVTTNDTGIYNKLLQLRNYGQSTRYYHDSPGINSRLDEMQAAMLRVKLKHLDIWNHKRYLAAQYYKNNLTAVSCLKEYSYGKPVYHLFVIKTPHRQKLIDHLTKHKIQSYIHYPVPINKQKAFSHQKKNAFPKTNQFANSIISIPLYPELSKSNRVTIVKVINEFKA